MPKLLLFFDRSKNEIIISISIYHYLCVNWLNQNFMISNPVIIYTIGWRKRFFCEGVKQVFSRVSNIVIHKVFKRPAVKRFNIMKLSSRRG